MNSDFDSDFGIIHNIDLFVDSTLVKEIIKTLEDFHNKKDKDKFWEWLEWSELMSKVIGNRIVCRSPFLESYMSETFSAFTRPLQGGHTKIINDKCELIRAHLENYVSYASGEDSMIANYHESSFLLHVLMSYGYSSFGIDIKTINNSRIEICLIGVMLIDHALQLLESADSDCEDSSLMCISEALNAYNKAAEMALFLPDAIVKHIQETGRSGGRVKTTKYKPHKDKAFSLLANSKARSLRQAAIGIYAQVQKYCKDSNTPPLAGERGWQTVYDWFNKEYKKIIKIDEFDTKYSRGKSINSFRISNPYLQAVRDFKNKR